MSDTETLPGASTGGTATPAPAATRAAARAIAAGIDEADVEASPATDEGRGHAIISPARTARPDTGTTERAMINEASAPTARPPVHETPSIPHTMHAAGDAMDAPSERKSPVSAILAVGALAVVMAIAGGFYWWHSTKQNAQPQTVDAATTPASAAQPAPAAPSPAAAPEPLAPAPQTAVTVTTPAPPAAPLPVEPEPEKVANVPAATAPTVPAVSRMPPKAASPLPEDLPKPGPGQRSGTAKRNEAVVASPPAPAKSDPIVAKVSILLMKADSYIANRQYDKAIATAESALELDPTSSGAKALISIAKSRQTEALRSGSSLE